MNTEIEIGATPYDEPCAQVGEPGYEERARAECRVFIRQIRRAIGPEPAGARLVVRSHSHDFGLYQEVGLRFDDDDEAQARYAAKLEDSVPDRWDETARIELGLEVGA
jgi:hypothetical protein